MTATTASAKSETPRALPAFRVGSIVAALADEGIDAHRDAVVRASDKFLHVATRPGRRGHRQWSAEEIDQLVVAFRLRHETGLLWPRIAEMFADGRPLDDLLADELDSIRTELVELEERLVASEQLLRDIKDGRTYLLVEDHPTAAA